MINKLQVFFAFSPTKKIPVGEMLKTIDGTIYFQFNSTFLEGSLAPSPFKLKAVAEPQSPHLTETQIFDGIFGVFADSLPDGWGLMMMSRAMKKSGQNFSSTSALDRLAFTGNRGMGALVYEPDSHSVSESDKMVNFSNLQLEIENVLDGKAEDVLPELLLMGGSPGGARPKVLIGVEKKVKGRGSKIISGVSDLPADFEHWIVKFNGKNETPDAGIVEFIYAETARHVGLKITETRLFSDKKGHAWFGTKRFDRSQFDSVQFDGGQFNSGQMNTRIHIHTAAGLVHANYRMPSLDYEDLLKLTSVLTRHDEDLQAMFRLAAFNVIFHNRDDHAKNFSYTMSEEGQWRFAPAYDLTYSTGPGGEHTTAILGEGKSPSKEHLFQLALRRGIKPSTAKKILDEVEAGGEKMIDLLKQHGVKNHPIVKSLAKRR